MELTDIYHSYLTENIQHECKARLDRENTLGWMKTIAGFANNKGGTLFLGVEDKTNKLIGYGKEEIDKEKIYFFNEIKQHFPVLPEIKVNLLPYVIKEKERFIIKIDVLESDTKPVIIKYQGMPMIFMRRDGYTEAATTEEIIEMSISHSRLKYDTQITDIPYHKEDFKTLYSFYKENTKTELKDKELAAINFFDDKNYLAKGSLLFSDSYDGNDTLVVCSLYKGLTRGDSEVIASNEFKGNLIACYKYIYEFINLRMNHGFIKMNTKRIDIDAFPQRSIFEAIINALAHRDYFVSGSAIYVDLFKNRLVISSPGGLYGVGEITKTYNLDSFISKRRNELISNVFILCKAMEAKGTGFEKIVEDYKDADLKHKPFIFSKNNQFSIVLPDLTYEDGITLDEDAIRLTKPIEANGKYDTSILAYCFYEYKNVKEITEHLNISNSSYFRQKTLNNLVKQGFLIEKDESKGKSYITNHLFVDKN